MLYVFHGSEINKSLEKARTLANSLRTKRPDATYLEVDSDKWSPIIIEENIGGQGLFSSKYIVFLNRVTENSEAKDNLVDYIQMMQESSNIFILLEVKLNAELKKSIEKYADKVVETDGKKDVAANRNFSTKKEEFNIFALGDAIGSRNSLKSWNIYRQAIDNGLETEAIIGVLFWKIKSLITTKNYTSYSKDELDKFLTDLIKIYHDSHRGLVNGELAMERMMLKLR